MTPVARVLLLFASTALVPLGPWPALANPSGPTVAAGAAAVSGEGTASLTVNQATERAVIDWRSFDIGNSETTTFIQPGSGSVALNRVTGGLGASQIEGSLKANGKVFLINPDGILFGPQSVVDVGGLVATTNDVGNHDFMAGRYIFGRPGKADASVVNAGTITAADGGFAALVAPGVRNSGTVSARLGKVGLAAANRFTLDFYGDKLLTLTVGDEIAGAVRDVQTGETLDALVKNEGTLRASGGTVELSAAAARRVIDSVINTKGIIEANAVGAKNGRIVLSAVTADRKPAGAPRQKVKVAGTLSAAGKGSGETGGRIMITSEEIALSGAAIDASGTSGGGTVLVGGDVSGGRANPGVVPLPKARLEIVPVPTATTVAMDGTSTVRADATVVGDGGKVVLWADRATEASGTISVRGGAAGGDGGFAEVSGGYGLDYAGLTVDVAAPVGTAGTVLFDPFTAAPITAANVGTITSILNQGNGATAIVYGGSVSVNTNIFKTAGSTATLKIFGDDGITIAPGVTIGSSMGALNIKLDADADVNSHFSYPASIGTVTLPFADPAYPGGASTSEHGDSYVAYAEALANAFFAYVAGGKVSVPSILTTNLTGQNFFDSISGYVSSPAEVANSVLTTNGANFFTNGGTFQAFDNRYLTTQDMRGIAVVPTANLAAYLIALAAGAQVSHYAAVINGADTDVFYRLSSYQRVAASTPAGVSFGGMVPQNILGNQQVAAVASSGAWDRFVGTVMWFVDLVSPLPFLGASDAVVEIASTHVEQVERIDSIADNAVAAFCSENCTEGEIGNAAAYVRKTLLGGDLESIREVVIRRARELGYLQ